MSEELRRARHAREMEALFLPDYDAQNKPSADKRAAYAFRAYRLPGSAGWTRSWTGL